ncbi:hypothetical protein ACSBR1_017825 [Camellia fascicularis]
MFYDFANEAVRRKLRKKEKCIVKEVSDFLAPSKNKVASNEIASGRTKFHFTEHIEKQSYKYGRREQAQSFVCDSWIIGREEDKKTILEMVMEGGAQGDLSVIAIVGIGGLDKTTLAQLVYKNEMWVCVSNVFNLKVFVEAILKSANGECGNLEIDELQNGEKGSKIVVTTRSEIVARVMGTTSPYHLKGLLEDDSWSLFKQLAFRRRQLEENLSLVAIGKKILTNSGGVPLAIKTVGSLLYLKDTEIEWLIVKDKLWEITQHETHILPTLKGTLIKLWMAQGFIHSLGKDHDLEDIADKYFNDFSCSSSSWEVPASMLNARKICTFFLLGKQGPGKRATQDALISSFTCLQILKLKSLSALVYIDNNNIQYSSFAGAVGAPSSRSNVMSATKGGSLFLVIKKLLLFDLPLLKEWLSNYG